MWIRVSTRDNVPATPFPQAVQATLAAEGTLAARTVQATQTARATRATQTVLAAVAARTAGAPEATQAALAAEATQTVLAADATRTAASIGAPACEGPPDVRVINLQPPVGTPVLTGDTVTIAVAYCAVAANNISFGLCFTPDKGPQGNAINQFFTTVDQDVRPGSSGMVPIVWRDSINQSFLPRTLGGVIARLGVFGLGPAESEAQIGDYPGC